MAILPNNIIAKLEETSKIIAENLHYELWDDAANVLALSLKKKAVRKYGLHIAGTKMMADLQVHISNSCRNDRYKVIQRAGQ